MASVSYTHLDVYKRQGMNEEDIEVAWVPGAFEIPVAAQRMAQSKKYDAIICLGAVIKGSTSHYDYVLSLIHILQKSAE